MEKYLSEIKTILHTKDFRLTPQREAILKTLLDSKKEHLSVEEIYLLVKETYPEIGLATIYRTMELFENLGIIQRLDFGDGRSRYEVNDQQQEHYHHHLICLSCGKIIEFNYDLLEDLEEMVANINNFKIVDHCLRFYGYCEECSKKVQKLKHN